MKILLSAKGRSLNSKIDERFGRAKEFIIYDNEKESLEFIENTAKSNEHGAGPKAIQIVIDNDVDFIITGNLGDRALKSLKATDIKAYKSKAETIEENLNLFKENKLEKIE